MRPTCALFIALILMSASPLSAAAPKFGYIMPPARSPLTQPALDRYANDLRSRIATGNSLDFVSLAGGREAASPENCKKYDVVAFFEPGRRWHLDKDSVEVHAMLRVTGCDGTVFYDADIQRQFDRDSTEEPQQQIDAATAEASTALAKNFEKFRLAHVAEWNKLLADSAQSPTAP
jgi:hypothetical protein